MATRRMRRPPFPYGASLRIAPASLLPALTAYARNLLLGTPLGEAVRAGAVDLDEIPILWTLIGRGILAGATSVAENERGERLLERFMARLSEGEPPPALGEPARANLDLLARLLSLCDVERATLQFLVVTQLAKMARQLTEPLGDLNLHGAACAIAAATLLPSEVVFRALAPEGRLLRSGIVTVAPADGPLAQKIALHAVLLDLIFEPGVDRDRLVSRFLPAAAPAALAVDDYAGLASELRLARELLDGALSGRRVGFNLLLHGPTGTGKTELARLLAREVGATLHVVGQKDDRGESATAQERLASLLLGNRLLGCDRALLLFDEMEDLFEPASRSLFSGSSRAQAKASKQWLNWALETNAVPTVWITNDASGVDPAFLRRFAYVIEMRPPGWAQRRRLWQRHLDGVAGLDAGDLDALAERFETSPGPIATTAAAVRLLPEGTPVGRETIEAIHAPGHALVFGRSRPARGVVDGFDLAAVHSPVDLAEVVARLEMWQPGTGPGVSLCLHGPPGTGKTEFVRYLARRMGRRIVERRVSDLLSHWVGMTELQQRRRVGRNEDAPESQRLPSQQRRRTVQIDDIDDLASGLFEIRGETAQFEQRWRRAERDGNIEVTGGGRSADRGRSEQQREPDVAPKRKHGAEASLAVLDGHVRNATTARQAIGSFTQLYLLDKRRQCARVD